MFENTSFSYFFVVWGKQCSRSQYFFIVMLALLWLRVSCLTQNHGQVTCTKCLLCIWHFCVLYEVRENVTQRSHIDWLWILAIMWSWANNLSVFSVKWQNNSTYINGLLWDLNKLMYTCIQHTYIHTHTYPHWHTHVLWMWAGGEKEKQRE